MRQQPPVQQPKTDMSRMQTLRSEAAAAPDKPTGASLRPCMWRKRWDATIPARAAAARNTSIVTEEWTHSVRRPDLFRKPALHTQGRLSFSGQATLVRPYTFLRPAKPVSAKSCRAPACSEFRTSKQTRRQDPDRRHDGKKRRQVVPKEIGRCPETALPNSFQASCIPCYQNMADYTLYYTCPRVFDVSGMKSPSCVRNSRQGLTECTTVDHKSRTTDIEIPSANAFGTCEVYPCRHA